MESRFDAVLIGAGPAGYVGAIRLAQLGKKVAVVEEARVGGVCLNRGCIPVKSLLHAAAVVRNAQEARVMGITFQPPELDPVSLNSWKARIIDRLARGIEFLFKANGVELFRGKARIVAPDQVVVQGGETETRLSAPYIIIATGSEPAILPGLEPNHKNVIDSNSALNLVQLPLTIVIVGAGAIGLEFATIFRRLGAKVTVLEVCDSILPGIDRDLTTLLQRQMEREGIQFHTGVKGLSCPVPAENARVCAQAPEPLEWQADKVLIAVGRTARTAELGIENLGIKVDQRGFIVTNGQYETNIKGVYAIGDVRGGPLLAHKAMYEGFNLAEALALGKKPVPGEKKPIPAVVYTDPEIATVGLTETMAQEQGLKVKVARVPVNAIGRSLTLSRSEGMCKLVMDEKTGKILGGGVVAAQADVLIAEITAAVELGLTAEQLGKPVHPHPTMSELVFETAHALLGSAIHIVNR
nr:dihydrolipoyl dehydrogenase [candidate division WOR-3 bacterium]